MSIQHFYSQTVADGTATSVVRPSDWNSVHNQVLNIGGNTAGTSQISGADIVWAGGNNVTLSANGSTVTIVGPNTVAQTVQTQASGNIAGQGFTTTTVAGSVVAATHNSAGLLMAVPAYLTTAQAPGAYLTTAAQSNHSHNFATTTTGGSNIVVGTTNSAGATIGVPAFITTYAAQTNQTVASGNIAGVGTTLALTNATATLGVNSAGVALSLSVAGGGVINQTGPNIAVAGSTITSGDVYFSNSPTVTFGMAGSTITASAAGGGGGGAATLAGGELFNLNGNTVFTTLGQNSLYVQKFLNDRNISFNNLERRATMSSASSSIAAAAAYTIDYGMYSAGTGASTSVYNLIGSSQMVIQASYSSNLSAGFTVSQGAASVTNTSAGTVNMSALSGFKHMYMPFTNTVTAGGDYAFAMRVSSATTGNTGALRLGFKDMTNYSNLSVGRVDVNAGISISNVSRVGDWAQGVYSATSSNLPATLAKSGLTNQVAQARMYLQFDA